jgi:hypothetical protein
MVSKRCLSLAVTSGRIGRRWPAGATSYLGGPCPTRPTPYWSSTMNLRSGGLSRPAGTAWLYGRTSRQRPGWAQYCRPHTSRCDHPRSWFARHERHRGIGIGPRLVKRPCYCALNRFRRRAEGASSQARCGRLNRQTIRHRGARGTLRSGATTVPQDRGQVSDCANRPAGCRSHLSVRHVRPLFSDPLMSATGYSGCSD